MSYFKKYITCFIFLLMSASFLNAQLVEYINFPSDTSKWTQTVNLQGFGPGMPYTEEIIDYYSLGDTLISGLSYQKIYRKLVFHVSDNSGYFLDSELELIGGLREDAKRIYFLSFSAGPSQWDNALHELSPGNEYLLYDFNIEIGDTLHWMYTHASPGFSTNVLIDIDTIELTPDHFREKFIFSENTPSYHTEYYWITGIGSSFGLFGSYRIYDDHLFNQRTLCYNDRTTAVLINDETRFDEIENCDFYFDRMNNEEESEEENIINDLVDLKVFPNPFNNEIYINVPKEISVTIELFDINSKLIYKNKFEQHEINFTLPNLQNGFYVLKATSGEKEEYRKLLKLNSF